MLVTVTRYRAITGDADTYDVLVSARIEEATDLLEDRLERPLRQGVYTEAMYPDASGALHPRATPIIAAAGYTTDGYRLLSSLPFTLPGSFIGGNLSTVLVPYTGGFVERSANPTDPARLPVCIERDLAYAVLAMSTPRTAYPAGARSVALGDARIDFGANGAPDVAAVSWSRQTLRYAYRAVTAV